MSVWKSVVFLLFLLCLPLGPTLAETRDNPQSPQWNENIERAKRLLERQEGNIKELIEVRQQLVDQRDEAMAIVASGSVPLRTLKAQLDALGPAPSDTTTESEQLAERRKELQKEISQANEPLLKAEEVVRQSGVLIKELDSVIRQRTTTALLVRDPSPLIPTGWKAAATELADALRQEKNTLQTALKDPHTGAVLKSRMPLSIFLFVMGTITITFGRRLVLRRLTRLYANSQQDKLLNWPAISINCAHLGLPGISAAFFLGSFYLLHPDFHLLKESISFLPLVAVVFIVGHWLGHALFSPQNRDFRTIQFDDSQAAAGYWNLVLLGLCLSLLIALQILEAGYQFSKASRAVLTLPVILLGGALLWRFAGVLSQARRNLADTSADAVTESTIEGSFLLFFSQILKGAALLSVFFIILGFTTLAREIMAPMIVTVGLLGLTFFLFRTATALLTPLFSRAPETPDSSPTLLPIIVTFFIIILTLPLLALTWGMRWTTLVDIWWSLNEGIKIGETRISLDIILLLAIVFTLGVGITRWLQKIFRIAVLPRTKLDIGGQNALVTGIGYTGITISVLIAISSAGLDLSNLAILAGALSVGIGFGLQTIASNFVSGIILLIERPIKEGDWIDVSGFSGYVRKISVRSTRIETFDSHDVIIPNADLVAGVVKNMTLSSMTGRIIVPVGVAYGTDPEDVKRILLEIAANHQMVLQYPQPTVLFMGLGASSIDFELRCFVRDVNSMLSVRSDMYFIIYKALGEAGIEIPFPQRVVTMKKEDDPRTSPKPLQ